VDYKININERISKEIKDMGYNFSHIGTIYLIETIEIIYNSKDSQMIRSVEKNVYSILAEKHSKNSSTIKSDIIKATNYMYEKAFIKKKKEHILYEYGLYDKETPKSVINSVLLKLQA